MKCCYRILCGLWLLSLSTLSLACTTVSEGMVLQWAISDSKSLIILGRITKATTSLNKVTYSIETERSWKGTAKKFYEASVYIPSGPQPVDHSDDCGQGYPSIQVVGSRHIFIVKDDRIEFNQASPTPQQVNEIGTLIAALPKSKEFTKEHLEKARVLRKTNPPEAIKMLLSFTPNVDFRESHALILASIQADLKQWNDAITTLGKAHTVLGDYNIACYLARMGKVTDAVKALEDLIEHVYGSSDQSDYNKLIKLIDKDSDLNPLRQRPDFQKLRERLFSLQECTGGLRLNPPIFSKKFSDRFLVICRLESAVYGKIAGYIRHDGKSPTKIFEREGRFKVVETADGIDLLHIVGHKGVRRALDGAIIRTSPYLSEHISCIQAPCAVTRTTCVFKPMESIVKAPRLPDSDDDTEVHEQLLYAALASQKPDRFDYDDDGLGEDEVSQSSSVRERIISRYRSHCKKSRPVQK